MKKNLFIKNKYSQHAGFSLLEVLITVFILAIGLLGLAALQTTSLKNNHSAQHRTSAVVLAYDIIDRMRLNRDANYTLAMADTPAGATLKDGDLIAWTNDLLASIPSGDGEVQWSKVNDIISVSVEVQWDDSRATSGSAAQSFTVSTEL